MHDTDWAKRKAHYQRQDVVASYNAKRFRGDASTRRKWKLILRAASAIPPDEPIRTVLDLPCGTGRFTGRILDHGWRLVNADISMPMLREAFRCVGTRQGLLGGVRADAERLPFADASVDLVLCIRFLMHVPGDARAAVLGELRRVTSRWLILDVRHRYCLNHWVKRLRLALGFRTKTPLHRYRLRELTRELETAGLRIVKRAWLLPPFSEKLVLLCERTGPRPQTQDWPGGLTT